MSLASMMVDVPPIWSVIWRTMVVVFEYPGVQAS